MTEPSPYLEDVAALRAELDRLRAAVRLALDELQIAPRASESAILILEDALGE